MEKVTIIGGQFATGNGKQGNFVAHLDNGDEIFVLANRMNQIGITKDTPQAELDKKFPLFGLMGERTFNQRNPDYDEKDPNSKEFLTATTTRKEIKRVFLSADDLAKVTTSGEIIKAAENKAIVAIRKANKLTDEDIAILQNADY